MGSPATVEGHVEVPGGRIWYRIAGADRPDLLDREPAAVVPVTKDLDRA